MDGAFVNKLILPGKGRKYSGSRSKGLVWLRNSRGWHFPNHYIRKSSKTVLLYSHGNGGTLGDFKHIVSFYAEWFNMSVFAIEYPSYGPAEGDASEETVNDNLFTAYNFLTQVSERGGSGRGREVSTARGADELLHDGDEDTTPLYLTSLFNPTSRSHK